VALAKVTFHPGASEDYAAAYSWYHDRGTTLAANFETEVDRGVRLISQNPLRWPKFAAICPRGGAVKHGEDIQALVRRLVSVLRIALSERQSCQTCLTLLPLL
jgi:hypothetical protein